MGVYEERAPPTTGMHWPASSQERGSGLAVGRQGGPGSAGGPGAVEQARDLSPCLPASMGDAARPTTLPCSPPAAHHHGSHHTPHHASHQTPHQTPLHQTHCGTNNNCYDGPTTPYDSRDYDSPGGGSEYRNNNGSFDNNPSDLSMPPQGTHHHHHHHHHSHLHAQTHTQEQQTSEHLQTIPKLEPPPTPPAQSEDVPGVVCAGCGLRISDRYYLQAVDRRWHASCLQCSHCRQGLDNEVTCFCRNGNIYCKKDYYRMFGSLKRCARCQAAILASELVMRARDLVFHVRCFSCAACAVLLTKGDHFGMRDGTVLCRLHYEMGAELHPAQSPPVPVYPPGPHYAGQFPSPEFLHHHHHHHHHHTTVAAAAAAAAAVAGHGPPHPHSMHPQHPHSHISPVPLQPSTPSVPDAGSPPKVPYFNGAAAATTVVPPPRQKGRPRKRKPKDLEAMTASLDLNADYIDMPFGRGGPGTPGIPGSNSRTKRMRTSFKHHQLRTMKSYFAINHNPDAKDLKQLSQKTGLPKRVLQVWFQNARAKWRRMVLKQEGKSDKCDSVVDGGSLGDLELYGNSGGSGGPPMSPPFMLGGPHSPASLASLDCA
ncbi:protein apterous-like isoform X1 [Vespa mandarinia]|uniref:protein apterous-like isoform X1 n=2 Tax=Vespa mandarinia TaxID=7446 RepID=UPI0016102B1F|nr:protein apterous-like isoform X1 [Vespa mandarinia]XP_046824731.1 protein apterous-like isoform X1 [Vespa crabro]XP_047357284.1 protein apterous-like isoform X1 [Vespa velutina]